MQATPVVLLYVIESVGSSPGRKGFIMAASPSECIGTIGGGIMEYKLVEFCRDLMNREEKQIRLITQYHDKSHTTDQSGMICSGMQRVAIIPIHRTHQEFIESCIEVMTTETRGQIEITPVDIRISQNSEAQDRLLFEDETSWEYRETIGIRPKLHIIGAGHVSLALSELMSKLGFYVIVYDDRPGLNTLTDNRFAHERHIVDYNSIEEVIMGNEGEYLVIMTIGYRTDKIILQQLIDKPFKYLGMLGSEAKIKQLSEELLTEGWTEAQFAKIHAPVGIKIFSQTANEIAVSVAAEIIREKNSENMDA